MIIVSNIKSIILRYGICISRKDIIKPAYSNEDNESNDSLNMSLKLILLTKFGLSFSIMIVM